MQMRYLEATQTIVKTANIDLFLSFRVVGVTELDLASLSDWVFGGYPVDSSGGSERLFASTMTQHFFNLYVHYSQHAYTHIYPDSPYLLGTRHGQRR